MTRLSSALVVLSSLAAAPALIAAPAPAAPAAHERLPFVADDYPGARAEANRRGLPLFVEVWAPW